MLSGVSGKGRIGGGGADANRDDDMDGNCTSPSNWRGLTLSLKRMRAVLFTNFSTQKMIALVYYIKCDL